MNDEIKEILEYLKSDNWEVGNGDYEKSLYKVEINLLLDYITNLQQENERKERLITQYGEGMCAYANRIDKAVEYINNEEILNTLGYYKPFKEFGYGKDLLNILQKWK